ncbi:MAG: hypothetical protein MUO62_08015, partial [Anaerolineales bacterium]|nr:hypothetical protein [Anaerolineales bacterium]
NEQVGVARQGLDPNAHRPQNLGRRVAVVERVVGSGAVDVPHVHLVEPLSLGGEMGHYSGEDMPEKSSMMAYSDVMVTVYSTMVVEASVQGTPVISLCIDAPTGWQGKFTLPLSLIGGWPTHQRYRNSGAGREAVNEATLKQALDHYLVDPQADGEEREIFLKQECTYLDGSAGKRTAQFLLNLLDNARV